MKLSTYALMVTAGVLAFTVFLSWKGRDSAIDQIGKLEEQFEEIQGQYTAAKKELATRMRVAEKEKEALLALYRRATAEAQEKDLKISMLQRRGSALIAEAEKAVKEAKEANKLSQKQKKIKSAASIAEVMEYEPDLAFVILDGGENRGLEPGMKFSIRRDHFILGRIQIDRVESNRSIANVSSSTIPVGFTIRKGDAVIKSEDAGIFH